MGADRDIIAYVAMEPSTICRRRVPGGGRLAARVRGWACCP
jgi:hypothetical protein